MDNFQIETAQNIGIQQNVAGIGDRILAFLVDGLIIVTYVVVVSILLASALPQLENEIGYYMALGLGPFLYHLLWETFYDGRSPGKALLKTRVVRLDGTRPRFSNYLVRWLLRLIDISIASGGVAVVTILFNGKGQRLGDLAAGTTVISEKPRTNLSRTLQMDLPENYTPKYPQVTVLKDKDLQEIKNLFQDARMNGQHHVILRLSEKISEIIGVTPDERPVEFIQRVIADYNYYTMQ